MITSAELLGYVNSSAGPAGFILPIFHDEGGTYIQQVDEAGCIKEFAPIDVVEDELIVAPARTVVRVGGPMVHAFLFPTGHILAGDRQRVQEYLTAKHEHLKAVPYARLDALMFIGALDDARAAVAAARNTAAVASPSLADYWAASQQRYIQDRTTRLAGPVSHRPVLLVFSEGYLSWPELRRQIAWAAERNFEVRLRFRLVRACPTAHAAELVETFGLHPRRMNGESAFIRVDAGAFRRLQEIGNLVMVVEAIIKFDQVVEVRAIDKERIRKRYFKHDDRKRMRLDFVPDYHYEART